MVLGGMPLSRQDAVWCDESALMSQHVSGQLVLTGRSLALLVLVRVLVLLLPAGFGAKSPEQQQQQQQQVC